MIGRYEQLWREVMRLDNIQHFDVVYLDCDDLKSSLAAAAHNLSQMLLDKVASDHRTENMK